MKVIKLGASWCSPCKVLSKNLEGFDSCEFEEFDIDENQNLLEKYGVRNIPTLVILDGNDKVLDKVSGVITKEQLETRIKNASK